MTDTNVFISYAHLDNRPRPQGQEGWVEEFHRELSDRVQELLGDGGSKVWRDRKLTGNPYIELHVCTHGGHCGFVGPRSNADDGYWAETTIVRFVERHAMDAAVT